nr:DUF3889 domain-containing protein [Lysinibacillus timonensis]
MKKLLAILIIAAAFFAITAFTPINMNTTNPVIQEHTGSENHVQDKPIPAYAKWGLMAMQETMKKYPNAAITDYLHIGRDVGATTSTEKFKLILQEKEREFGLLVNLEFDNTSEQLIEITFTETTP